jgi:hypothetical protein
MALASSAAARALALKDGFWAQMGQSLSIPMSSVVSGFTTVIINSCFYYTTFHGFFKPDKENKKGRTIPYPHKLRAFLRVSSISW